jgi:hypothetical protein
MDGLNLQASVNNVTQMDKHQQDQSRSPLVHLDQNAVIAREDAEKRLRMPVEPDHVDGKKVDPRQEKRDRQSRRRKQNKNNPDAAKNLPRSSSSGYIVDIEA